MIPRDRAIVNILCVNLVPLSIGAGGKAAKKMNWNGDDPDGYCWAMPLTPASFGAGSQPEHDNVREPWLANLPFNVPGQGYMSASSAAIESATVSPTYIYILLRV